MPLYLKPPLEALTVNQAFGSSPDYYARFKDAFGNPEKGHMGTDFRAAHGTPVFASHDGLASFQRDEHGGEGVYIRTVQPFAYKSGTAFFRTIYWHLCGDTDPKYPSPLPMDGKEYPVKAGQLIGFADNTGAPFESSGDHLHFGLQPLNAYQNPLEPANGFGGCIDPMPYILGSLYQQVIDLLSKIVAYLKG